MAIVLERGGHLLELAAPLHEHVLVGVDEDVADARVAQERLERAEAEDLVHQLAEQHVALAEAEGHPLFGQQLADERADLALGAGPVRLRQRLEVQPVQEFLVNGGLQLDVLRARSHGARARAGRAFRHAGRRC